MHIQVNTDKNIQGTDRLALHVQDMIKQRLARFAPQVTRFEVHLSDENGVTKSGNFDKRCLLEARLAGREPAAVTGTAQTIEQAVAGATQKMESLLDTERGKREKR